MAGRTNDWLRKVPHTSFGSVGMQQRTFGTEYDAESRLISARGGARPLPSRSQTREAAPALPGPLFPFFR